jgi:hypothetical protein
MDDNLQFKILMVVRECGNEISGRTSVNTRTSDVIRRMDCCELLEDRAVNNEQSSTEQTLPYGSDAMECQVRRPQDDEDKP